MSIQALAWVIEESEATLGARNLMFAIANHADEHGGNCWASVATLAHEARISRTATQKALRRLEDAGEIEVTGEHRSGTKIRQIVGMSRGGQPTRPPGQLDDEGGPTSAGEGANLERGSQAGEVGPNRPKEPSEEPSTQPVLLSPQQRERALVLCAWLSEQADEKRTSYTDTQIEAATWLLEHVNHAELKEAVQWAHTRAYWASRVRTAGRIKQNWDDLRAEWRGATGRNGSGRGSVGSTPDDLRAMAEHARSSGN